MPIKSKRSILKTRSYQCINIPVEKDKKEETNSCFDVQKIKSIDGKMKSKDK